jgi:hypothetical protein
MQFKHPEILYFLCLLIVPILVHLFRLQKFKKTPFTNVAFLQKIIQESRKSSELKKWLILTCRLLLFSAIIIAFSQPYFSDKKASDIQHNFIYIDNSLSTDTKGEKGNLLQNAVTEIIESANQSEIYSLKTNSEFYQNISYFELKKLLLNIRSEAFSLDINEVLLNFDAQNQNKIKTLNKGVFISDFQIDKKYKYLDFTNVTSLISFIQLQKTSLNNLSIDSTSIESVNGSDFTLNVYVRNQGEDQNNIPISIFNDDTIFAKQLFSIKKNEEKTISFPIQNRPQLKGKISINFNDAFDFDNHFFFNINLNRKINVFSIGNQSIFLSKIYTNNEFNFSQSSLQNINYNLLKKQELIILNELTQIPTALATFLTKHLDNGKSIVVIPNSTSNRNSYNTFFKTINIGNVSNLRKDSAKITEINFKHPFLKNVFSKSIDNFQYPSTSNFFSANFKNSTSIIKYDNKRSFLSSINSKNGKVYWFSNALNNQISNFTNSPLVVPVFYNFGKMSTTFPKLFYRIGAKNTIDIPTKISNNQILSIRNKNSTFIPLQLSHTSKVTLTTEEQPITQGFHEVTKDNAPIETLAFNNPKSESSLNYLPISELIKDNKNLHYSTSVKEVFHKNQEKNKVTWLWKWFLTLAIVSLLFEILILKFFKP